MGENRFLTNNLKIDFWRCEYFSGTRSTGPIKSSRMQIFTSALEDVVVKNIASIANLSSNNFVDRVNCELFSPQFWHFLTVLGFLV